MPSKIEWTDETWNPITGCTPVSEGCDHCYAKRMATRLRGRFGYPQDDPFAVTLHPDKLDEPLHWKKPRMVFVCSMGDLFHKRVSFEIVDKILYSMLRAEKHIFQILTKRPERMLEYFETMMYRPEITINRLMKSTAPFYQSIHGKMLEFRKEKPFSNIWLGVTVENQVRADERIPILSQIPAAVRFVSVEPMLGPVDLKKYLLLNEKYDFGNLLNWVICGGETGPGARPMHPAWARNLRDQCQEAGVPFFFKQWGEYAPISCMHMLNRNPYECQTVMEDGGEYLTGFQPAQGEIAGKGVNAYKVGKKRAGRLLDGRTWDGMPKQVQGPKSKVNKE